MWLFSSSTDTSSQSADAEDNDRYSPMTKLTSTMKEDEESLSTIVTPQESHDSVNIHDSNNNANGHVVTTASNVTTNDDKYVVPITTHDTGITVLNNANNGHSVHNGNADGTTANDGASQQTKNNLHYDSDVTNATATTTSTTTTPQPIQQQRTRGMIYFRSIQPSDRTVIQKLHEQWFPVDYKSEFFDTLCHNDNNDNDDVVAGEHQHHQQHQQQRVRRRLPGAFGNEPLYCCVACFKELDDVEFEERVRRREDKKKRTESGIGGWRSSFCRSPQSGGSGNDEYENKYDDDDCLLWELDNSSDGSEGNNGSSSPGEVPVQKMPPPCDVATNNNSTQADNNDDDDAVESGDSVFSIHHRTEREKMKQFYSNGFRHDGRNRGDSGNASDSNSSNNSNRSNNQQQQNPNTATNSNNNEEEGPYYNDNGEQIVGCIVGSFLSSTMPASCHHSSTATEAEKLKRDETASLLVPDHVLHKYTKMFYIMTLGTSRKFRRCGLGSLLVERVVDVIREEREECGALYLHVITYNLGAIRLYERMGFARVKEIKDYYTINSVNYDCFLYARYFHGNRGHKTTFGVLYDLASSIIRKLSYALIPAE